MGGARWDVGRLLWIGLGVLVVRSEHSQFCMTLPPDGLAELGRGQNLFARHSSGATLSMQWLRRGPSLYLLRRRIPQAL